jgi:NTE family protein
MLDGGLRQNTPLSPAVRLGAARVLVVHTQAAFDTALDVAADGRLGLASLLGKALNALMIDPIDRDLQDLELVNSILDWGVEAYGPDHVDALNRVASAQRATPLRPVRALLLRPSEDVGRIAADVWNGGEVRVAATTRLFLDMVARSEDDDRKELLAYVLFDASFTGVLEALGHADAMAREEEIARFLRLGSRRSSEVG